MKKCFTAAALAVAALAAALPASAATVSLTSANAQPLAYGATLTVDIVVSGLASGVTIKGFDFDLTFSGLLTGNTAMENGAVFAAPFFLQTGSGVGNLGLAGVDLDDGATAILQAAAGPSFTLATFTFTAGNSDGTVFLDFGNVDAATQRNLVGWSATDLAGVYNTIASSYNGLCVAVGNASCNTEPPTGVPEPASFGLAAVALLGAGAATRRRRTVRSA